MEFRAVPIFIRNMKRKRGFRILANGARWARRDAGKALAEDIHGLVLKYIWETRGAAFRDTRDQLLACTRNGMTLVVYDYEMNDGQRDRWAEADRRERTMSRRETGRKGRCIVYRNEGVNK
jgi:hypothetical protein